MHRRHVPCKWYLSTLCPNTSKLRPLKVGLPNTHRERHLFNKWNSNRDIPPTCQTHTALSTRGPPTAWLKCKWAEHQCEFCQPIKVNCISCHRTSVSLRTQIQENCVVMFRGYCHIWRRWRWKRQQTMTGNVSLLLSIQRQKGEPWGYLACCSLFFGFIWLPQVSCIVWYWMFCFCPAHCSSSELLLLWGAFEIGRNRIQANLSFWNCALYEYAVSCHRSNIWLYIKTSLTGLHCSLWSAPSFQFGACSAVQQFIATWDWSKHQLHRNTKWCRLGLTIATLAKLC